MIASAENTADREQTTIKVMFDGGSKGNPGKAYGSYLYWGLIENKEPTRIEFSGLKTNNQAEYLTLIAAIRGILSELDSIGIEASGTEILIRSDSELLVKQLNGQFRVKSRKLKPLYSEAKTLLATFQQHIIEWHARSESVRWLGH